MPVYLFSVLTLEKKKELVRQTIAKHRAQAQQKPATTEEPESNSDNSDDEAEPNVEAFLDWRAKRSQLKKQSM